MWALGRLEIGFEGIVGRFRGSESENMRFWEYVGMQLWVMRAGGWGLRDWGWGDFVCS